MAALPYVTATGNVDRALVGVKTAATPDKVTQDFVKTILKIPGGSGDQINSLLKKIGFVNPDGIPSDIYKRFRNNNSTAQAAADALRTGYGPLFRRNEFWPAMNDEELRGLIIEETGHDSSSTVVTLILNTIKGIRKFASFDKRESDARQPAIEQEPSPTPATLTPPAQLQSVRLNIGYTINLNLPATSDAAIFKSLKENLLREVHGS